jgi:V/A-type H+-transporting ATPase subunit I
MKKVSLVVIDKNREGSLEKLRELGLLHLERKSVSSESLTRLLDQKNRGDTALGILRSYAAKKKAKGKKAAAEKNSGTAKEPVKNISNEFYSSDSVNEVLPPDPVTQVLALGDEKKNFQERLVSQIKEQSRIEKWGNFDPKAFGEFAEKGIVLIPYELPGKTYESLGEDTKVILLGKDKAGVRLLAVGGEISGETPFALGDRSLTEIGALIADIQDHLADLEKQLAALAESAAAAITASQKLLLEQIEFETARGGMEVLEDVPPEATVSWITGFLPSDELGLLKRASSENGWAFIADDPGPDDEVPTKLKNNKLASLIYPLTNFLEVVPGYHESDISGWFLFFFCIFFGMIFGDAGYGAILLLIGIIGCLKTAKKGTPAVLKMLVLLAISNFAWGVLTCTWFGIDPSVLPEFIRNISLPQISGAQAAKSVMDKSLVDQNLMIFCFSLGLLQLSIGHIIGIIRNIRSLKWLSDLGNVAMLLGMYYVVLMLVVSNDYRKIDFLPITIPIYLIGGGFVLTFVFANYEGSIGRSILESLKNIISVILGITNVFSDIMSYIRLWAVGLAGASISSTVNTLAGPLLGSFLIFLGIILLVFGHGLNLILNVLSVLVHGVRLNTLEFSSHTGLAWSGTAYKPFAATGRK